MDAANTKTRIIFRSQSHNLFVKNLDGFESVSQPFKFSLTVSSALPINFSTLIGQNATLSWTSFDNFTHSRAGVVTQITEIGEDTSQHHCAEIILTSRLERLKTIQDCRVYLDFSLTHLCDKILTCANYNPSQVQWQLSQSVPDLPMVLQANESHFDLFHRLLSEHGLYYFFDNQDDREKLIITDQQLNCPYIERSALSVKAQAGLSPFSFYGCFSKQVIHQHQPSVVGCHWHPQPANAQITPITANQQIFDLESPGETRSQSAACYQQQALDCLNHQYHLTTNVEQLTPGFCFSLIDQPISRDDSGDYLVLRVEHSASQVDEYSQGADRGGYHNKVVAIPREIPFRSPLPKKRAIPFTVSATIESGNHYAQIDEQGRYRARFDFDQSQNDSASASQPLRKLTPYACAGQDRTTGLHFPLLGGDKVLLSCLNHDPNSAYIIGFAQQDDQLPVVTAENLWQNRIVSASGNELLFDDTQAAPRIVLQSLNNEHKLELNATQGAPFVELLCQFGALTIQSGKSQWLKTEKGDLREKVGGGRLEKIAQNHKLQSQQGSVRRQSGAELSWRSENQLTSEAKQNTHVHLRQGVELSAGQTIQLNTKKSDLQIFAPKGSTFIQAQNNITIQGNGGGDIILENNGGGIKMDASGNVTLFGKVVSFDSDKVSLNGEVSYDVASPPSPPKADISDPEMAEEIEAFELENDRQYFECPMVQFNIVLKDEPGQAGFPLAQEDWVIVQQEDSDDLFFGNNDKLNVLIRGTADDNGRVNVTDEEQQMLSDAIHNCRTPLWLIYQGNKIQLNYLAEEEWSDDEKVNKALRAEGHIESETDFKRLKNSNELLSTLKQNEELEGDVEFFNSLER